MKTFTKYLLFCVAAFALWACELEAPTDVEASNIDFYIQYVRGRSFSSPITVITSKDEFDKFYEKYDKGQYSYSDDFFEENYIVVVSLWEPSGSIRHRVERIDENGDIVISRLLPEIGTDDIGEWSIIIGLSNDVKIKQFKAVFVDVKVSKGPTMDSRVVSYQPHVVINDYVQLIEPIGYETYGFTTNKEILKLWFPHIFNEGLAKSECNYFALYHTSSSSGLAGSYEILSQDMVLHHTHCTWGNSPGLTTEDFAKRAMLICDDKNWTLKESIDFNSVRYYEDPHWNCWNDNGAPDRKEIYF
ncbi:MAG: hypothetical protein LBC75_10165 [Fibromonadaceae bacterium]|jgi:hypothetical protein|nr:hypothetical protein [Fibromonadaceae bacterium]